MRAEYIIIGTLMSFGAAVAEAHAVRLGLDVLVASPAP
jgi:hypothetical protein